uniref:M16 family metallopeptidase n=1 Tax=Novosphingobium sp. B 225 TaxID=1961849 RepID=UPI001124F978
DPRRPAAKLAPGPKRTAPPVAPVGDLAFPGIERARLGNGIPVALVRRSAVPKVVVNLNFDAGTAADALDAPGTQSLMLAMLDEGTERLSSVEIAEAQERLGATISAAPGLDSSAISLDALTANLAPSLALLADVVRNPAFRRADVERVRDQRLSEIAQTEANPRGLASRAMAPLLYGPDHPYGLPSDGLGTAASVGAMNPVTLSQAHRQWIRADGLKITVVGDVTMAQLLPLLEQSFGSWGRPASAYPGKDLTRPVPAARSRIVLIDRANSPQSVIMAGRILPLTGREQGKEALDLANEVLGNGFLSRLNLDLREDKGWSYGVRSTVSSPVGPRALTVTAPVQADRTGDSILLIMANMAAFPGKKPVDPVELGRVTDGNIRGLPNRFQTNAQVLGAVVAGERLGRPDDYIATLASRYRAIDGAAINAMARQYLTPEGLTFVVVGDRKVVEPQLRKLGLPLEIASPVDSAAGSGN